MLHSFILYLFLFQFDEQKVTKYIITNMKVNARANFKNLVTSSQEKKELIHDDGSWNAYLTKRIWFCMRFPLTRKPIIFRTWYKINCCKIPLGYLHRNLNKRCWMTLFFYFTNSSAEEVFPAVLQKSSRDNFPFTTVIPNFILFYFFTVFF